LTPFHFKKGARKNYVNHLYNFSAHLNNNQSARIENTTTQSQPMNTKIMAALIGLIMSILPATAQLKNLSIAGAGKTVASSGEVTATSQEITTAAAILRAEVVTEAGEDRYGDLAKKNTKGFQSLRASDARSLEQLLPALAESLERVASGIPVEYPDDKELAALKTAVGKIRVDGPTGQTTEGQIIWSYTLAKAMLRKELKCSNPAAPAPASTPPPAVPATPPAPAADDPTNVILPPPAVAPAPASSGIPAAPGGAAASAPKVPVATPVAPAAPAPAAPKIRITPVPGKTAADGLKPAAPVGTK
jgi:hypothetical protein